MVQIIDENRPVKPSFGRSFVGGLVQGLPEAVRGYQENQALKKNYGVDLTGITDPQTRQQVLTQELMYGRKRRAAEASRDVSYAPRDQYGSTQQGTPEPSPLPMPKGEQPKGAKPKDALASTFKKPSQMPQKTVGIPESQLSKEGISSAPQFETSGQKVPVLNPQQIDQEVDRVMTENNRNPNNIPINQTEARQRIIDRNNENIAHNARVEQDQVQKQDFQTAWGEKGVAALAQVMEKPTGEMNALMMRKGEEISTNPKYNKDQSSMNRQLAVEANKLKDQISNIENGIKAGRAVQKGKESLLGKKRADEAREKDVKVKIQPLLDQGLYDTTRQLLSKLDFGPEETENLITNLGEMTKKSLAEFPKVNAGKTPSEWFGKFDLKDTKMIQTYDYTPEQREKITQGVENIILADPSVNLLLLRRDLRDKDVDWDIYKDAINDLVLSGKWQPNQDQLNAMNALEQPPLDALDKITHGFNLIGY